MNLCDCYILSLPRFQNRRRYGTGGPSSMWHVDGNDKLIGFGFYIHGCVDGYSRKVIWLKVGLLLSQKLAIRRLSIRLRQQCIFNTSLVFFASLSSEPHSGGNYFKSLWKPTTVLPIVSLKTVFKQYLCSIWNYQRNALNEKTEY